MLRIESELNGRYAHYGQLRDKICQHGFCIGSNWEFDRGSFDTKIFYDREEGETIYLRMPFEVMEGMMDDYNTVIRFLDPYVIKHVVNVGLDYDGSSFIDATRFSQFQTPIDTDAPIINKNKWVHVSEELVKDGVLPFVSEENIY